MTPVGTHHSAAVIIAVTLTIALPQHHHPGLSQNL
jgi:hypothetical protein